MAVDFPSSPSVGQQYAYGGMVFTFTAQGFWTMGGSTFPTGTLMLFQQGSAPSGWTKQATHDDKNLRIVNGTVGSGGTVGFSTVFGRTAADGFTLTMNEFPSHGHGISDPTHAHNTYYSYATADYWQFSADNTIAYGWGLAYASAGNYTGIGFAANGSSAAHGHGIDTQVQYVDLIVARKD